MKIFTRKKYNLLHQGLYILLIWSLLAMPMVPVHARDEIVYYHNDALGSPVAATDEQGNLLWQEEYQPYGERILKQDNGKNSLWYTGKPEEKDFGINYFGARWYDPSIGRFMAVDPMGFKENNSNSFNRYAYANNNPYRYIDPGGLEPELVNGGGFGANHPNVIVTQKDRELFNAAIQLLKSTKEGTSVLSSVKDYTIKFEKERLAFNQSDEERETQDVRAAITDKSSISPPSDFLSCIHMKGMAKAKIDLELIKKIRKTEEDQIKELARVIGHELYHILNGRSDTVNDFLLDKYEKPSAYPPERRLQEELK